MIAKVDGSRGDEYSTIVGEDTSSTAGKHCFHTAGTTTIDHSHPDYSSVRSN